MKIEIQIGIGTFNSGGASGNMWSYDLSGYFCDNEGNPFVIL
jgi:hypothetical protein